MKSFFNVITVKTSFIFVMFVMVAGCGMSGDQMIKQQIEGKKKKIAALEKEIAVLEGQLSDTATNVNEIAVDLKTVAPEKFRHYITVFGNVEADKYAKISPEMNGQVRTIHVREGQRAGKGDLLVSLNTDATESGITEAKAALDLARTTFEKQENLWKQNIGSEIQYLQAKTQKEAAEARLNTLQAQLRMSQIRAPFNGLVDKIYLKEGDMAGPAVPVIEFVNLARVTIKADISESYIGSIHAGENVEVSFASLPDLNLTAKIVRASKVINPSSRTFSIELSLANPGEKIRPNMISSIRINDFSSDNALVVPTIVIKRDITGDYLYVASVDENNNMVATKRYVRRGVSYDGNTMINSGLNPGDKVVVAGYNLISTGSYLAEKM